MLRMENVSEEPWTADTLVKKTRPLERKNGYIFKQKFQKMDSNFILQFF